jgi:uncharacterized protein YbaR (Trm112 family)
MTGLDPLLLEVLACPLDKGPLLWIEDEATLYNPRLRRRYGVEDGVPDMLVDESTVVDEAEHERLLSLVASGRGVETGPTAASGDADDGGDRGGSAEPAAEQP